MRSKALLLLYTAAYLAVALWVASLMHARVSTPYMDEPFHVAQTQAYCRGEWSRWDPKITTFPGLYVSALPYASAVHEAGRRIGVVPTAVTASPTTTTLTPIDDLEPQSSQPSQQEQQQHSNAQTESAQRCSLTILRSINVFYGVLCIPLVFQMLRTLHPQFFAGHPGRLLLITIQLSLFPLIFFFQFLYYTDLASVFWTLASYLAHQRRWRFVGSTLGVAAVLMRQTNIAWVAFICLAEVIRSWSKGDADLFGETRARFAAAGAAIAGNDDGNDGASSAESSAGGEKEDKIARASLLRHHPSSWSAVPRSLFHLVTDCVLSLPDILFRHFGPLLTCAAFVVFVFANGRSIVLGDRDNHAFSPHLAQLLYFVAFAAGATAPNWLGMAAVRDTVTMLRRNKFLTVLVLLAMAVAVHFFTIAHPFLLSDNRHYPFYVWKNLFRRWSWFRYALLPVYVACGCALQRGWSSAESRSRLFQLLFWLVTALCLVPTPLLEPRYFLTPFTIWFLHSAPKLAASVPRTVAAIALYAAVNAATIGVFIYRPFTWVDGTTARFMW